MRQQVEDCLDRPAKQTNQEYVYIYMNITREKQQTKIFMYDYMRQEAGFFAGDRVTCGPYPFEIQVLGRFESVQDVLIMCLVRMLACGNRRVNLGELERDITQLSKADLLTFWFSHFGPFLVKVPKG